MLGSSKDTNQDLNGARKRTEDSNGNQDSPRTRHFVRQNHSSCALSSSPQGGKPSLSGPSAPSTSGTPLCRARCLYDCHNNPTATRVLFPTQTTLSRRTNYCIYKVMQTPYPWAPISRHRMKARVRKLRFPGSVRLSSRAVVTVCHEHAKFAGRVRQNAVVAHQYAGSVKSWELGVSIPFLGGSGRNGRSGMPHCVCLHLIGFLVG